MNLLRKDGVQPTRVLVTGGAGFLGRHLVRALRERGTEVVVLVRRPRDARGSRAREELASLGAEVAEGDLLDAGSVRRTLPGVIGVFHLAGRLFTPDVPDAEFGRVHVEGTRLLLEACADAASVRSIVHCSTTGVVGATGPTPLDEDAPPRPGNGRMARARRDDAEADWAAARATAIESQFDRRWWSPAEGLYFDSQRDCAKGIQAKQHRHWTNAVPMEVGLALPSRARKALERLESPEFSGTLGLFHTGVGGGPDGKGELKIWTVPTSVMAVAEANYGRLGETQAQRYIDGIATQLDLEMPGALPEVVSSPEYDPSSDLGKRLMFMQAWSAYGIHWPVVSQFLGVRPDVPAGVVEVIPHLPPKWPEASLRHLRVGRSALDVHVRRGTHELRTVVDTTGGWALVLGSVLSQDVAVSGVSLDGASCLHEVVDTPRGRELRVRSVANGRHELVVRTQPIRQSRRPDP